MSQNRDNANTYATFGEHAKVAVKKNMPFVLSQHKNNV